MNASAVDENSPLSASMTFIYAGSASENLHHRWDLKNIKE